MYNITLDKLSLRQLLIEFHQRVKAQQLGQDDAQRFQKTIEARMRDVDILTAATDGQNTMRRVLEDFQATPNEDTFQADIGDAIRKIETIARAQDPKGGTEASEAALRILGYGREEPKLAYPKPERRVAYIPVTAHG